MKNYIKATLLLLFVVSVTLLLFLCFSKRREPSAPIAEKNPPPEAVSGDVIASAIEEYLLIAEDNYLNLYHIGESPSLKHSEYFNKFLLPKADILLLSDGIRFQSLKKAYEAMESFVN